MNFRFLHVLPAIAHRIPGDKAYIVGGMENEREEPLASVECFDPTAMAWRPGLAPLRWPRFGHACCAVPGDEPLRLRAWAPSDTLPASAVGHKCQS